MSWNIKRTVMKFTVFVDLFVRSWVETLVVCHLESFHIRRPLREVVSWNLKGRNFQRQTRGRPLREVVSWNTIISAVLTVTVGRPLREVVSWNIHAFFPPWLYYRRPLREVVSWNDIAVPMPVPQRVDLFVRSWVETCCRRKERTPWRMSTSSWGRELKHLQIWFDAL